MALGLSFLEKILLDLTYTYLSGKRKGTKKVPLSRDIVSYLMPANLSISSFMSVGTEPYGFG